MAAGNFVELLARRDCGSAEFTEIRTYLKSAAPRDAVELLYRPAFHEWVVAHKEAIKQWFEHATPIQ